MAESFDSYLKRLNLATNTIASYVWTVNHFVSNYGSFTKENLLAYKGFLMVLDFTKIAFFNGKKTICPTLLSMDRTNDV